MAVGQDKDAKLLQPASTDGALSSRLNVEIRMDEDSNSSVVSKMSEDGTLVEPPQNREDQTASPGPTERLAEYELSSQLGDGAYGTVLLANHRKSNQTVAIKRMKNTYLTWKDALKEMEIVVAGELKRHPNIIHMLEAFREAQQLYMVFEFMDCNLYQLMKDRSIKRFSEDETRSIAGQIFCGLQYLHEKGFFHRDLKPENILCNGTEVIKIADFGQARHIRSRPPYTEYVSTRWYRAPELVLSSRIYSLGVDIWAVGCIMAEIVTLRPLFDGATAADQLFKIVKLLGTPRRDDWPQGFDLADRIKMSFPPGFERQNLSLFIKPASPACEEVIAATLQYNPQARPSAKSCLYMPFFAKSHGGRRSWDASPTDKTSTLKRQSIADPVTNPTTRPKPEVVLPKIQAPEPVRAKALPDVRDLAQGGSQLIPGIPRHPVGSPNKPFVRVGTKPLEIVQKQSLLRRHESQNVIPTTKYSPVTVTTTKNPVQKFLAKNSEKVTKSSTSPDLMAAGQTTAPGGESGGKSRFRTENPAALQPAKYGHMQRILVPRRESRKNLDPHQSTELGSRRLLEANRVLRKISADDRPMAGTSLKAEFLPRGSSTSPVDEFPDPFMASSLDESKGIGDRRLGKAVVGAPTATTTGPDKPWAGIGQSISAKAHQFSSQKAQSSSFLIRPTAQLNGNPAKVTQPAPAGDRRSQEPSWWDK